MVRVPGALLPAVALCLAISACGPNRPPFTGHWVASTNLLDLAQFSEVLTDTRRIEFDAQEAGRFLGTGWGHYEQIPEVGSIVWATAETAMVRLTALSGGAGELVFSCAPAGGPEGTDLDLTLALNRKPLRQIRLEPRWQEYKVRLRDGLLTAGENQLQFRFSRLRTPKPADGGRDHRSLAALFDYVELRLANRDGAPRQPAGAPPQPAVERQQGSLLQLGPSRLDLFVELPAEARLAGRVSASSAAGLEVTLQPELGSSRTVLEKKLEAGPAQPIVADLAPWGRKLVRVSLQLDRFARARWSELAIQVPERSGAALPRPQAGPAELPRLESKSSIIIVVFDAAAASHYGCYGYARRTTPNVDAIAAEPESVVFEQASANAPYTLTSTGSLFTGMLPQHHGVVDRDLKLADDAVTLAEYLKARGFTTAGFSMNAFASEKFGFDQGFDFFLKKHKFHLRVPHYLDSGPHAPLFMYLHYINPHAPYQPKPRFRHRFLDPNYKGSINASLAQLRWLDKLRSLPPADLRRLIDLYDADLYSVDAEFGMVVQELKRRGLYDHALLILTSDHGEAFYQHGRRGHNTTVYEEMLHIPLVMKFPKGMRPRQHRISTPVQTIDLLPTALALTAAAPPPAALDGRSLLPLVFGGGKFPPRYLAARAESGVQTSVRDQRFKLVLHDGPPGAELFDLKSDPGETRDLSASNPVRAGFLLQHLRELIGLGHGPATAAANQMDEKTRAELRALGYL